MSEYDELVKRHGDHHKVNIKYGYLLAAITFIIFLIFNQFPRLVPLSRRVKNFVVLGTLLLLFVSLQNYQSLSIASVYIKRLGRLSVSLLPLNFYLSLKVPGSRTTDYLSLVWLHKWISRTIVLGSLLHGAGYFIFFINEGKVVKVLEVLNLLGVLALIFFGVMFAISLRYFRRKIYKWFYSVHIVLSYAVLILLQLHARPGVSLFSGLSIGVIIYSIVVKYIYSFTLHPSDFQVLANPDSDLIVVIINNVPFQDLQSAENGGHLRVSTLSQANPLYYLTSSHPYTMIKHNNSIKLVIRKLNFMIPRQSSLTVFGPFNSCVPAPIPNVSKLLFIAGGTGISFTLSLYQQYKHSTDKQIKFIWIVRNVKDLWLLSEFQLDLESTKIEMEIYVTSKSTQENFTTTEIEQRIGLLNDIELDEFQKDEETFTNNVQFQKPFIPKLISDFFSGSEVNGAIVSCGPQEMNYECEGTAKREEYGGRVACYNEVYEM